MDYKQLFNKPIIAVSKFVQIDFGPAMINEKSFIIAVPKSICKNFENTIIGLLDNCL